MGEAEQLNRLREQQELAIAETQHEIGLLEKFKQDYEVLKERLLTLADKVSYDIMVPIGKKAFMPGRIVHTNEILVLLGDNWFVEQSAKQSSEIVDRRIAGVDKQIKDLKEQKSLLQPRLDFTSQLQGLAEQKSEMFEIKEDYDPEKEKLWKEEHSKKVRKHRTEMREEKQKEVVKARVKATEMSDEELWARLDQLETQEASRREMEGAYEDEDKKTGEKSISWKHQSSEEESEGTESEEENPQLRSSAVLNFKHSESWGFQATGVPNEETSTDKIITSPSDIYKYFMVPGPASILKKSRVSTEKTPSPEKPQTTPKVVKPNQAFSGAVIESTTVSEQVVPSVTEVEPPKRISKFKAQRMQQKH